MFYAGSEYLLLCACLENSLTKINVKTAESAREEDIFIIQSRCSDVNDNLMELLILMSACKTASTRRITRHYPAFSLGADGQGRRVAPVNRCQARRQYVGLCRMRPYHHDRPSHQPDTKVLRHTRRFPLLGTLDNYIHLAHRQVAKQHSSQSRCGWHKEGHCYRRQTRN